MPAATKVWNGNQAIRRLLVSVGDLRPHPRNPRLGNVQAIKASLERFGQQRPILALPDGTIVAGNHTYLAAQEVGWTHVAVVRSDLTDMEIEAYLLADNRTGDLGAYEDDQLAEILRPFYEADALYGIGYERDEVEDLIAELAWQQRRDAAGEADAVVEPPEEAVSQPGEIYELGSHRLMCGDAENPEHVAALLADAEPVLLLTDPPYGVELDMEWRDRAGYKNRSFREVPTPGAAAEPSYMQQRTEGHRNTTISGDTRADWSEVFELVPSLKIAYVWHASTHACEVLQGLERIGFVLSQQIIWRKPMFAVGRNHYNWQHEPCWYLRKTGSPRWRGDHAQSTVWDAASPKALGQGSDEERIDHPTQKPVVLYTRPVENHLRRGDAFYDPFGGSGTAIIAGEMTGRPCFSMELDPRYCDVIRARYAAFSGQPELAPSR